MKKLLLTVAVITAIFYLMIAGIKAYASQPYTETKVDVYTLEQYTIVWKPCSVLNETTVVYNGVEYYSDKLTTDDIGETIWCGFYENTNLIIEIAR